VTDGPWARLIGSGRWLFGDRQGLVLWLGLLCWFGLTWRIGFFIQDTYATANTLVALADGQLHVTELRYSVTFGSQPGLYEHGGRLYGRNYGQLVFAVPLVWALELAATVVDPRLLLAGLWAGLGLALVTQLGELPQFDRHRTRTAGTVVVTVLFVVSVLTATELPFDRLALVAYQLSTMVAAATAGLLCYRLVWAVQHRHLGLVAGAALGIATPVGFWATLPKRHTLVAMLVLGAVYAFAVSREREGRVALRARAGAYAFAGLITWVHAFEALFVVCTLGAVDLLTARSNGGRELVVVVLVLCAAMTPMLATNYAISGNPAEPPRVLSPAGDDVDFPPGGYDSGADGGGGDPADDGGSGTADGGGSVDGGGGGDPADDGGDGRSPVTLLRETVERLTGTVSAVGGDAVVEGIETLSEPERLWHTFVRSGTIPSVNYSFNEYETIELSLLEAMPLLGALVALPVLAGRRLRTVRDGPVRQFSPRNWTAGHKTDLLVVALAAVVTVVYLARLPLFSMLTVRYLHPVVALAAYGVCRIPAVRSGVAESRWLGRAYLVSLLVALGVLVGGISGLGLAVGEAVQYNALWNLGAAVVCAGVVLGRTVSPERVSARLVAVGIGIPAGFTTAFLVLSGLVYFRYGSYGFDLVRLLAETLPSL